MDEPTLIEFDYVSDFSSDLLLSPTYINASGKVPEFSQIANNMATFDYEVQETFGMEGIDKDLRSDILYIVLNFTAWYVAMQDRMSDAELAMFGPVLDRMMSLVTKINETQQDVGED